MYHIVTTWNHQPAKKVHHSLVPRASGMRSHISFLFPSSMPWIAHGQRAQELGDDELTISRYIPTSTLSRNKNYICLGRGRFICTF